MRTLLRPRRSLTRSPLRRALSLAGAAMSVVCWLAFAPTSLGGSYNYVTTYGTSMEPTLHRGDLAIVRAQPAYRVGDVVAYRSSVLHTIVLHRIIGRDGDRFVFKGDNNAWNDTDHPLAAALIGRMEMRVPGLGAHVRRFASPPGVASMATVAALPIATTKRRRRRRHRTGDPVADESVKQARRQRWRHVEAGRLLATAVATGVLVFAFSRPSVNHVTRDLPFDDRGEFSYTGAAPNGGAAYQAPHVSSGQPIFLNLVDKVDFVFIYRTSSAAPLTASGDVSLSAMVTAADGWSAPLALAEPAPFRGGQALATGTLDLRAMRAMITRMENATGLSPNSYNVVVRASVDREVRHDAAVSAGTFAATLPFVVDDREMRLVAPGRDALTPSRGGLLTLPLESENRIDVLGHPLSISAIRVVAVGLMLIVAASWIDWLLWAAHCDETRLIERRYRNYLMPVRGAELTSGHIIDVEQMTGLVRVADFTGSPILKGNGSYHVVDGTQVYTVAPAVVGDREASAESTPPDAPLVPSRRDHGDERPLRSPSRAQR